jgi:hypothetical protein
MRRIMSEVVGSGASCAIEAEAFLGKHKPTSRDQSALSGIGRDANGKGRRITNREVNCERPSSRFGIPWDFRG